MNSMVRSLGGHRPAGCLVKDYSTQQTPAQVADDELELQAPAASIKPPGGRPTFRAVLGPVAVRPLTGRCCPWTWTSRTPCTRCEGPGSSTMNISS